MKRFMYHFARLQWKMAFSYALNMAIVLFVLQILLSILTLVMIHLLLPQFLPAALQEKAVDAVPYFFRLSLWLIIIYLLLFFLFTLCVGSVAGFFVWRGFTRRFVRLSNVVEHWGRGDFSMLVRDQGDDEFGQLSHGLDHLACQLQNLLYTRQKFGLLEARNLQALSLHDTVKQQVFAVSLQVSTARALLRRDVDRAEQRILEAERLIRQAQDTLTTLNLELRPTALEGKGLAPVIQEYVSQWSQQNAISVDLHIEGTSSLAVSLEEAFYRVLQEALANIVLHSQASAVQIQLNLDPQLATLSISDNGRGFAVEKFDSGSLFFLRERMKAFEGHLKVQSAPGEGTTLIATCKSESS